MKRDSCAQCAKSSAHDYSSRVIGSWQRCHADLDLLLALAAGYSKSCILWACHEEGQNPSNLYDCILVSSNTCASEKASPVCSM